MAQLYCWMWGTCWRSVWHECFSHVLSWSSRAPEELGCVGIQELELILRLSWGWSHIHFRGILCSLGFCLAFLRSNLPMVCEHEGPSPRPLKQETGTPLNLRPQETRKQMAQNTGNICAKKPLNKRIWGKRLQEGSEE